MTSASKSGATGFRLPRCVLPTPIDPVSRSPRPPFAERQLEFSLAGRNALGETTVSVANFERPSPASVCYIRKPCVVHILFKFWELRWQDVPIRTDRATLDAGIEPERPGTLPRALNRCEISRRRLSL